MDNGTVFQRVEKKYQMTCSQYEMFLQAAGANIHEDDYGLHTIHNIYYDTEYYDLIRSSIEKPKYKEKFRLRGYGSITEDSLVYLEIKKKYQGIVYKRRTQLTCCSAMLYLEQGILPSEPDQIMREIHYFMEFYRPEPKVYLAYDRKAYVGSNDSNLRITVDKNIRGRHETLTLEYGGGCQMLEPEKYFMEIKAGTAYPIWLARLLSDLKLYPISFSKYGTMYSKAVLNGDIGYLADFNQTLTASTNERKESELCLQAYSAL